MTNLELVKHRKSVRTFDGEKLKEEDLKKLQECVENLDNPYNMDIEYRFLDAKENGLKSPVLVGENTYIAAKMKQLKGGEEAFGYSFEKFVLFAESLGLGTVWIGGTMNRDVFEQVMGVAEDEVLPCVSPIGYPAKKRSLRENMMRKGIKADTRKDFGEIFFENDLKSPLNPAKVSDISDAFEMVRWAPSAVNKQPWRIVKDGNNFHFYEMQSPGYVNKKGWDMQKIDMGIALCHFEIGLKDCGKNPVFSVNDPGIAHDENMQYIATYSI